MAKQFLWQWESHRPAADPSMNPTRAARLLRAWRNQMRTRVNGRPYFTVNRLLHLDGWREYQVTSKYGERGSLWIRNQS